MSTETELQRQNDSDRHKAGKERKRAEEVLKQGESRLRAAFSQLYAYLVLLEPDGTIIEANRAALETLTNTGRGNRARLGRSSMHTRIYKDAAQVRAGQD